MLGPRSPEATAFEVLPAPRRPAPYVVVSRTVTEPTPRSAQPAAASPSPQPLQGREAVPPAHSRSPCRDAVRRSAPTIVSPSRGTSDGPDAHDGTAVASPNERGVVNDVLSLLDVGIRRGCAGDCPSCRSSVEVKRTRQGGLAHVGQAQCSPRKTERGLMWPCAATAAQPAPLSRVSRQTGRAGGRRVPRQTGCRPPGTKVR